KEEEERLLRKAMARPQEGTSTYVTGGDVSRFQRSSIPSSGSEERVNPGNFADAAAAPAAPAGPVVRVTRGKNTTVETVDKGAGALLDRQAQGVGAAGEVLPTALSTLR